MNIKTLLGLVIVVALTIGCASRRVHIEDWSFGTRTHGQVEAAGKDFFVVRFTKIETFGYDFSVESERKLNFLKLYRCEFISWCDYKVGREVLAEARGGKRMKDPIGYEIKYLQSLEETDIPFIRSYHAGPH